MEQVKGFLKRKNIVISAKRYGIDALGAMAQGLFCSLLIGTILNTIGSQFHIGFLTAQIITINGVGYTIGGLASFMSGSAMAVAIGYALQAPPMVLFSLVTVGYAANELGSTTLSGGSGAGGPLAVLFIAVIAAELGKAVSKETKIDILVTPLVTILVGVGLSALWAPAIGTAASAVGDFVRWATVLQPFWMGILVSVVIGIAQGLQPIVSYNYGARHYHRVRKTYLTAAACATTICLVAFACFQLFPRQIIGIFGSGSEEYFQFAERYFRIYLFCTFANGLQPITSVFFTSIGKAQRGIFISLTRQILFLLPLILILPLLFGIDGVMYAAPVADLIAAGCPRPQISALLTQTLKAVMEDQIPNQKEALLSFVHQQRKPEHPE